MAKSWSLKDEVFSAQRGNQIHEFEINGKHGRFMIMDPTTNDLQWWKSEVLKANPSKARKEGKWTIPTDVIPEIIVRCCHYPYDYGQDGEEKELGADTSRAGQPVYTMVDAEAIGNSTLRLFTDMADKWIDRLNLLYPIKSDVDAGNL